MRGQRTDDDAVMQLRTLHGLTPTYVSTHLNPSTMTLQCSALLYTLIIESLSFAVPSSQNLSIALAVHRSRSLHSSHVIRSAARCSSPIVYLHHVSGLAK